MQTLVDDIGSFPLPKSVERKAFEEAYILAREYAVKDKNFRENSFICRNFYDVIVDSFRKKCAAGLDVVNYPQHYDICKQFTEVINKAMEKGTYVVEEKDAIIPEVHVISKEAKSLCEELNKNKIALRVCVTGPMELYLKEVGTTAYKDVLLMFSESAKRFAKNAILRSKHVETVVVSLDEPSFGFRDVAAGKDEVIEVLEKAFNFSGAVRQIHVHSPARIVDLLEVKNIDVISIEYAASPQNIECISRGMLEKADKHVRVGVSRTDIDAILAELYEKNVAEPQIWQIAEEERVIKQRFKKAKKRFGERMSFTGPDCGLGGWPTQEAAQLVLKRTVAAVKSNS
ncbi:MAG: hypothetical protein QXJ94_01760 [Candidatus Bathyarchaeia archaeon]